MYSIYEQLLTSLYMIWRKRWFALGTMWAVCMVGWAIVAAIPDEYAATARIYVDTNEVLAESLGGGNQSVWRQVDVMRRTLVSRPNLEKVIRRTDLDLTVADDSDMERLFEKLTTNTTLTSQGADLFTVAYRSGDRRLSDQENANLAKRVVQNLINLFVEGNIAGQREPLQETIRFLEEQISDYETKLEDSERRKAEFERQNLGFLPGTANISQKLQSAQVELNELGFKLAEAQSARRALSAQLASTPATIQGGLIMMPGNGPRFDPASTAGRIELLERQISDAMGRGWTDQHPDITSARRQIEELRRQLASERKAGREVRDTFTPSQSNPVYVDLRSRLFDKDSEIASISARRNQLAAENSELAAKAESSPGIEAERVKLNRDYEALKNKYDELVKKREEARVSIDVETKTDRVLFRIVDPPEVPLKPVAPDRPLLLSAVMGLGLLAGLIGAFIMSQIHTTFASSARLRAFSQYPVLGSVSAIVTDAQRARERKWLWLFLICFFGLTGIYASLMIIEVIQSGQAI
jgi:polysaccharide biosynthesis transport protein